MSSPSQYGKLRFCPRCGVETLERDHFPDGPPKNCERTRTPENGVEYVCNLCGFGFCIRKSRRVQSAEANAKEARKHAPVKFTEKCVGSEIAKKYLEAKERPND